MASIKLKHTSGNGTILNSPAANPSSDVTLKLPSTTGSAGQFLQVASANHSATNAELQFAAAGGGKIKQFVYKNISTAIATTSSSYADATNFNLAITPTSATNLLYFQLNIAGCLLYDTSGSDHRAYLALTDDGASSYLQENQFRMYEYGGGYHLGLYLMKSYTITHIKTAGSTSARTYQLRVKLTQGEQFELNANGPDVSTMVIWEIEP